MSKTAAILGVHAEGLLSHRAKVDKSLLHTPSGDFVDSVFRDSDRNPRVLRSLQQLFGSGRLGGTGYLSILPVDQGVEHSAGSSFAPNPIYFDGENIVRLALEAGCTGVASTFGALASVARKYAHKIPFVVKINHNELLTYPNKHDQVPFARVEQAWDMGAVAIGATIYFGSPDATRQLREVGEAFARAHELGMATILWCYLRNPAFDKAEGRKDAHVSADLTGQANHLGATLGADVIKQKAPEWNGGYGSTSAGSGSAYGKTDPRIYSDLASDHPIDLTRYQVLNCFAGRAPLLNSGGASGKDDLFEAVRGAVINKRAGGAGLIAGRKAFQKPFAEGVSLLNAIQDVYLDPGVTLA